MKKRDLKTETKSLTFELTRAIKTIVELERVKKNQWAGFKIAAKKYEDDISKIGDECVKQGAELEKLKQDFADYIKETKSIIKNYKKQITKLSKPIKTKSK